MSGVVLLAECAASAVNKVGRKVKYSFQGRLLLGKFGDSLVFLSVKGIYTGVIAAGTNDLVAKTQSHKLIADVNVCGKHSLGNLCKGNYLVVLCNKLKREAALGAVLGSLCVRFGVGSCVRFCCVSGCCVGRCVRYSLRSC